jgi:hypothetical protein
MLRDHLNGLSFRDIGERYNVSKATAYHKIQKELNKLPENNKVTFNYCNKFSSVFEFDAKYVNVKGYPNKLAFLWGVDYWRHDFPIILLTKKELFKTWAAYFSFFRIINHYPRYIVCDNHHGLKMAARFKFPKVKLQTCYFHFSRGIKNNLRIASDETYRQFSRSIDKLLSKKRSKEDFNKQLWGIYRKWQHDPVTRKILTDIEKRKDEFLAFRGFLRCPVTTNMIEGFNSHLEERLKHINSFQSFLHAKLWLNAYVLKRRTTKLTNCRGKFRKINGKTPLEMTKKVDVDLKGFF